MAALTDNDMRVLRNMRRALLPSLGGNGEFDGYMPHGSADHGAIRRLQLELLVEENQEYAVCQTCSEPHEGPAFSLTPAGMRVLTPECDDEACTRFEGVEEHDWQRGDEPWPH